MKYAYRVINNAGQISTGKLEAEQENIIIEALSRQELYIISINREQGSEPIRLNWFNKKISPVELLTVTKQLAVMLEAGVPLLRAFTILLRQAPGNGLREVLTDIKSDIEKGAALHSALAQCPRIFSPVYVHMVEAGEAGGMLAEVLNRLARHLEKEREIRLRIINASVYPVVILLLSVIAAVFISYFIFPSFISLFASSGVELPPATRIMIITSTFLEKNILYIIIGLILIAALAKRLAKIPFCRYYLDWLKIKTPLIGKVNALIAGARFTHTIGTLLAAGIPILKAWEIVRSVIDNHFIDRALLQAGKNISEGQSITAPLQATGVFDPLITQMIAVGEETGNLDQMLIYISDYFNQEIMYRLERIMASLEPALIILAALLVGFTALAAILPVFQMITAVSM